MVTFTPFIESELETVVSLLQSFVFFTILYVQNKCKKLDIHLRQTEASQFIIQMLRLVSRLTNKLSLSLK